HEAAGRAGDLVRVVEAALPLADVERQIALHRDAAQRLAELGKQDAAIEHYAELLRLDPASTTTQRALRQLAQAAERMDRYAAAAAAAAERCADPARKVALLTDAARVRIDLDDDVGATELLRAALGEPGIPRSDVLTVGRRLDELLARGGRAAERLPVLEKLAAAETVPSSQRAIIGDIARLAEELGQTDRALIAWRQRLAADSGDLGALGALIDLLEKEERWPELIEALEQRAGAAATRHGQKRADLVRVARLFEREIGDDAAAVATWNRVVELDGGLEGDAIGALTHLYSATERWRELGDLLDRATGEESQLLVDQLVRLGEAHRGHLGAPESALLYYRRAIDIDVRNERARHGLITMLDVPACRGGAAEALGRAYRAVEDWPSYLTLVDARLASAPDDDERLRILREAAAIHERIGDPEAALAALARAFPLAPKDRGLADQLVRLARHLSSYDAALDGFRRAAKALPDDAHGAAQLRAREAELLEERGDLEGAHGAYFAVLAVDPGNLAATSAVVRIGSRLARWVEVGAAIVDCIRTRGRIEDNLLGEIDAAAGETHSYDEMCRVLTAAVDQGGLDPHLASEMHNRIALWHRDRRADPSAAEASFKRAAATDATRIDALRALVALEERSPNRSLYDTLERLADADPRDLDVVYRAAEVAVDSLADRGLAKTSLNLLLGRATAAWRGTAPARGKLPASDYVAWSVDRLVDIYVMGQEATAALDLLVDASRLPFDGETRLALRHRAAAIAGDVLRDEAGAIEMYRGILGQRPDDLEAIGRLAELYRKQDRIAELLALRRHELSLPLEAERRLELRLDLVTLIDDIDRRGGRLELLRANMADQPGHATSVAAITELLTAAGRLRELHDLLAEQARRLEMGDQGETAGRLWAQAARLAERELRDVDRAVAAYRRVIALAPTQEALDALARLYMERGEPAEAVPWLERALAGAELARKAELSLRLARAHVGAERPDRATTCLERAVNEGAGTREVRQLLADLYRGSEQWEPLAWLLTESLPMLSDEQTASAWAREAADIYHRRLGAPERALPALERALSLMPDERSVRAMMAGSLRAAGETGRARALLEKIIADFGRRRTKDRAVIHGELALVARAEGKLDEAVRELEQASQMDVGNTQLLKLLAQAAREAGQLDLAERSLRALLLVVRRQPPGDEPGAVGLAEVLFELHHIAAQRDDQEKAAELLESALEAARQSDAEVARLRRVLVEHKQGDLLLKAIEARLGHSEDPASRAQLLMYAAEAEADLLGRPDAALERLLEAMTLAPGRADLHARARDAAIKAGALTRYLDAATAELERMRRKQEAPRVARLAMALGQLAEEEARDLERARDLYKLANRLSDEPTDSLFALSRVYQALGDVEGQTRTLDELAALAGDDEPSPQRADALYRLAQVQASSPEMVARALDLLERGLRIEMRHHQAAEILRQAALADPENRQVLDIYERVARVSGDPAMLLDYLERRIARGGGDDESVKEAVELAVRINQPARAEALLRSAVAVARRSSAGVPGAAWAALSLAELCVERGEVAEAQSLLLEVGDSAPAAQFMELGLKLAGRAADAGDTARAAEIYQLLRGRDPTARAVWQPLFELIRRLGDTGSLSALVAETLPQLVVTAERNALRLLHARTLLADGRSRDAIELLRDALLDNPDDLEVSALLESALSAGGNDDVLADFLNQRFEDAKTRGNPETLTDVALRLGALLERMDGDAQSIYRDALEHAPDSRALLRAVVAGLVPGDSGRERAELLTRLLAVEEETRAPALALELSALWNEQGEPERALEAIELGHRASPTSVEIRDRLEEQYRAQGMWDRLAMMLIGEAEHATEIEDGLGRLRTAANIFREQIGDMRRAAEVLDRARALAPDDVSLVVELASCLASARDFDGGIRLLGMQLETKMPRAARVDLLLLRADLELALGREDDALGDLEAAHQLDGERTAPLLQSGLERQRDRAQGRGDLEMERGATMRLARLLLDAGEEVQARDLLVHWLERAASDREALYLVLQMDSAAERWDGVVA
ncbi:MAG TPA: tetratricopeptide repeat protein, partial [Kofleriaceae bacterium]|nr:tetratricopeptide repeat protein [Kofleriaceae bacterium]